MRNKNSVNLFLVLLIMTTLYLTESLPQNQRYRRDFVDDSSFSDETNATTTTTEADMQLFTGSEYSDPILSDESVSNKTDLNATETNRFSQDAQKSINVPEKDEVVIQLENIDNEVNSNQNIDSSITNQDDENDITSSPDSDQVPDIKIEESVNESSKKEDPIEDNKKEESIDELKSDEVNKNVKTDEASQGDANKEVNEDTKKDEVNKKVETDESSKNNEKKEVNEENINSEKEQIKESPQAEVESDTKKADDEGVFRTHTDMGNLIVKPKFNHTVKQIPKEVRLTADCPDTSCEFGYHTDLNGKTLCTCYQPCADEKCGSKLCIIKKINDKFQGLCIDSQKTERPVKCHLPVKKGGCRNYVSRFYFNSFKQSCEHFVFKGCDGNENNFKTWEECDKECNVCSQQPSYGTCEGHNIRYYFERSSGGCVAFSYGGCGGNKNNFESLKQCQDTCL